MRSRSKYTASNGLANSLQISGCLASVTAYNQSGSDVYLQLFEGTALPADASVPLMSLKVPTKSTGCLSFDPGIDVQTGVNTWWVAISSTDSTKTIAGNVAFIIGQYF